MEFRKYYWDMTPQERTILNGYIERKYKLGEHALRRIKEKMITKKQVYNVLKNGEIIEYHYKNSHRILLRGLKNEAGNNNICVVLDIGCGEIVTAYRNKIEDNHYTLRTSEYISNLDIINLIKYNKLKLC